MIAVTDKIKSIHSIHTFENHLRDVASLTCTCSFNTAELNTRHGGGLLGWRWLLYKYYYLSRSIHKCTSHFIETGSNPQWKHLYCLKKVNVRRWRHQLHNINRFFFHQGNLQYYFIFEEYVGSPQKYTPRSDTFHILYQWDIN